MSVRGDTYRSSAGELDVSFREGPPGSGRRGERWDTERFARERERVEAGPRRFGNNREYEEDIEIDHFERDDGPRPRRHGSVSQRVFEGDFSRQSGRERGRVYYEDDRSSSGSISPSRSVVSSALRGPRGGRRQSITIDRDIRGPPPAPRGPARPSYLRRQSSLDTFDRRPRPRFEEHEEISIRDNFRAPPVRELRPPPAREEIRIREDFRGGGREDISIREDIRDSGRDDIRIRNDFRGPGREDIRIRDDFRAPVREDIRIRDDFRGPGMEEIKIRDDFRGPGREEVRFRDDFRTPVREDISIRDDYRGPGREEISIRDDFRGPGREEISIHDDFRGPGREEIKIREDFRPPPREDFRPPPREREEIHIREDRFRDDFRPPTNVPIPLPRPRRSPPRFKEREYEEIRIAEPDRYGDEGFRDFRRQRSGSRVDIQESSESMTIDEREGGRKFPRRGKTKMPRRLIDPRAVIQLGYPYEDDGDHIVILLALGGDQIDEVISISDRMRRDEGGAGIRIENTSRMIEAPAPPPFQPEFVENRTEIFESSPPQPQVIQIPAPASQIIYSAPPPPARAEILPAHHHGPPASEAWEVATVRSERRESEHESERHSSRTRSRSRRRKSSPKREIIEESSETIGGPLSLFNPDRRKSKSERDIKAEIKALEAEKKALKLERRAEKEERQAERYRDKSRNRDNFEVVETDQVEIKRDRKDREHERTPDPRLVRLALGTLT